MTGRPLELSDLVDLAALAGFLLLLAYRVHRLEAEVMGLRVTAGLAHVHDDGTP